MHTGKSTPFIFQLGFGEFLIYVLVVRSHLRLNDSKMKNEMKCVEKLEKIANKKCMEKPKSTKCV